AILGQATGQASLPFFARLFGEKRTQEFTEAVNGSVYRAIAAALLFTSWMMAASLPLIDLLYRRGHFVFSDSQQTATYFFLFSLSLPFWSAQALYARAFYATGNTLTPMIASTLITLGSLPLYSALFHVYSAEGLAVASDLGIMANCLAMAILLRQRKLVTTGQLKWNELSKAGITAVVAGVLAYAVAQHVLVNNSKRADLEALGLLTITWAAAATAGLWITRSELPRDLLRRKSTTYPRAVELQTEELSTGSEP